MGNAQHGCHQLELPTVGREEPRRHGAPIEEQSAADRQRLGPGRGEGPGVRHQQHDERRRQDPYRPGHRGHGPQHIGTQEEEWQAGGEVALGQQADDQPGHEPPGHQREQPGQGPGLHGRLRDDAPQVQAHYQRLGQERPAGGADRMGGHGCGRVCGAVRCQHEASSSGVSEAAATKARGHDPGRRRSVGDLQGLFVRRQGLGRGALP